MSHDRGSFQQTRDAVIVIQTLELDGEERLARAIADFATITQEALGGGSRWAVASVASPVVTL